MILKTSKENAKIIYRVKFIKNMNIINASIPTKEEKERCITAK